MCADSSTFSNGKASPQGWHDGIQSNTAYSLSLDRVRLPQTNQGTMVSWSPGAAPRTPIPLLAAWAQGPYPADEKESA